MEKNNLLKCGSRIVRILEIEKDKVLIIDCIKRTMPKKISYVDLENYEECSEEELLAVTNMRLYDMDLLDTSSKKFIHEHFTMIAGVLPFIADNRMRKYVIAKISEDNQVSRQTIKNYLCLYLIYQDITAFAPKKGIKEIELSQDEKNMRWALNKFFYTQHKNSIATAYTFMLKEKYCDSCGVLLPEYPSIHQFRYFEKKYRKMQTYYISRDGIKDYQKNHRPLLRDGVQEYASHVGIGFLDSTICDIYLVNDSGNLVGRPILTACIDAYSGLCCGYALSWEGGTYSLRGLMLNVIADKEKYCKQFGISIKKTDWNCDKLPATLITDMGSEYIGKTFEQIAELGATLVNLPAYRPELKGSVEKFFDLIQGYFKPYLKGKGVIESDFQERGSHDYRRDACLTMNQFEIILLRCIIYYNTKRVIENYPYTAEMIQSKIQPFSSVIWNYGLEQSGADMIEVTNEELVLCLFPRTQGKFCRHGLKVNGMRYKNENYTEKFLSGGIATVAYNPDDVSCVWLLENGSYIKFELIESRYEGKNLSEVQEIQTVKKEIVKCAAESNLQAKISLAEHIQAIANYAVAHEDVNIKGIRTTRKNEQSRTHRDYMKGGAENV